MTTRRGTGGHTLPSPWGDRIGHARDAAVLADGTYFPLPAHACQLYMTRQN
ncbi:hypothetical protein [Komagataeibacter medellinensis]|uniref:hypothetical protein n=1 Tax=Komagataeibacter medellinensis TaxID=1177712 RepID=UPI001885CE41|nr:hypothetical protein [Komagataeibacter medellinensis]